MYSHSSVKKSYNHLKSGGYYWPDYKIMFEYKDIRVQIINQVSLRNSKHFIIIIILNKEMHR